MKILIIFFSIIISFQVSCQNYFYYQKVINRIDEDVLNEDFDLATQRLDSLYENYDFIYSHHCFKALQICCKKQDSIKAEKWLKKSFIQGIPIWMIRTNEITKEVFNYPSVQKTIEDYDSLRNIYKNSINHELRNKVDSLFIIDQRFTKKVNDGFILFRHTYHGIRWLKNNRKQFEILLEITKNYGFPGEKLIGLPNEIEDSISQIDNFNFYGPFLRETKVYIMLIHYYSNPRKDINDILFENVKAGNIPPYQFGALNDFMARWGKGKYGNYEYYNVWHVDPDTVNITVIEKRRNSIGLNSYDQHKRNMLIWRERRKNHTANSEIILE